MYSFAHSGCLNEKELVRGLVVQSWASWHENIAVMSLFCTLDVTVLTAILYFDHLQALILVQNKLS